MAQETAGSARQAATAIVKRAKSEAEARKLYEKICGLYMQGLDEAAIIDEITKDLGGDEGSPKGSRSQFSQERIAYCIAYCQ